jgi:cation:H+ antiporter
MMGIVWLLLGGGLLYFGAEWLVGGASGLARSLGVPQLLVGLTVVAYGTSAPEVVVGVQAAVNDHAEIALGNVIGSNIANLGLILGAAAVVRPARVARGLGRRELPVLLVLSFVLLPVFRDGLLSRIEALALLAAALGYTTLMVRASRRAVLAERKATAEHLEVVIESAAEAAAAPIPASRLRLVGLAVVGLGVLVLGGHLFVDGATTLALALGMSQRLVGLTVVAVGTSLPELATSLIAAHRGHSDIAVGNVVGSNIFNLTLCLGAAGATSPMLAPLGTIAFDIAVMLGFTLVAAVMMRTSRTVSRLEGAVLLAGYAAFTAFVILRAG